MGLGVFFQFVGIRTREENGPPPRDKYIYRRTPISLFSHPVYDISPHIPSRNRDTRCLFYIFVSLRTYLDMCAFPFF